MGSVLAYLPFFLCGAALYGLLFAWRKAASRWGTWFPLLKKGLEWSLIGAAIVLGLYILSCLTAEGVSSGPALLALVVGLGVPELILRRQGVKTKEETKRGASMSAEGDVARKVRASKVPTYLEIGGVPVPVSAEPYHFLIAGSTGTGKSVAIGSLLDFIRARGDTAIVVDSGGGFLASHYVPESDFIFNPFDDRCVGWSPTTEMQGVWDSQALARSIVPDGSGENKQWNSYAQTFVDAVLRKLWETQQLTQANFLYHINVAPREELQKLLADTPAASQMSNGQTFGSIRTIASNYVTSYDYLPTDKERFSVADMIRAEHSGMLFLTYRDDQLDSLRNIMACLLDVAARTILSLEPQSDRRIWLIIDEFASVGRVQSIEAMATKSRKAGGCLVLGIQSVSQLKDRYGDNGAQTILSCLSTWLVLRCSDADTAEYMSKYIGEAEIRRTQKGQSSSDNGETQSWSEQSATQRVVLGSQIQAFANLHGLLKLAGDYPVTEVTLPLPAGQREEKGRPFLARDFRARPLLKLTPPATTVRTPEQEDSAVRGEPPKRPEQNRSREVPLQAPSQPRSPRYSDKTPRPTRPTQKNLLVQVSQGVETLRERVRTAATMNQRANVVASTASTSSMPRPPRTPDLRTNGYLARLAATQADPSSTPTSKPVKPAPAPSVVPSVAKPLPPKQEATITTPATRPAATVKAPLAPPLVAVNGTAKATKPDQPTPRSQPQGSGKKGKQPQLAQPRGSVLNKAASPQGTEAPVELSKPLREAIPEVVEMGSPSASGDNPDSAAHKAATPSSPVVSPSPQASASGKSGQKNKPRKDSSRNRDMLNDLLR